MWCRQRGIEIVIVFITTENWVDHFDRNRQFFVSLPNHDRGWYGFLALRVVTLHLNGQVMDPFSALLVHQWNLGCVARRLLSFKAVTGGDYGGRNAKAALHGDNRNFVPLGA